MRGEEARSAAEAAAADARRAATEAAAAVADAEARADVAEHAQREAARRLEALSADSTALIDRRAVVKMLVSFFERGQAQDGLDVMSRSALSLPPACVPGLLRRAG